MAVASSDEHEAVGSTDWTNLTDATVSVDVADGAEGLLIVRFSALSRCNGALDGACLIRLLVDGEQMDPAFEEDSAVNRPYFDLVDPGQPDNPEGEAHTIERSIEGLGSGTHVVKVQYRNPASSPLMRSTRPPPRSGRALTPGRTTILLPGLGPG